MKNEFVVFSQRIAGMLMVDGYVLKRMDKNHNNPKRNVFIFNESEELLTKIQEYKLNK